MEWNEKWLNKVHIQNFKSIKDCEFNPKRINVLIGEPNSGKSNLLEGLSLLNPPIGVDGLLGAGIYREPRLDLLFNDFDLTKEISIGCNRGFGGAAQTITAEIKPGLIERFRYQKSIRYDGKTDFHDEQLDHFTTLSESSAPIAGDLNVNGLNLESLDSSISYYTFSDCQQTSITDLYSSKLASPHGHNIAEILGKSPSGVGELYGGLVQDVEKLGYEFMIIADNTSHLYITPLIKEKILKFRPITILADTLRRMMFYHAAIATNKDAVLLFEEPEAHSFPPYITQFANWVLESETNQFFIATHSPYLLSQLLTSDKDDVAVFLTYLDPEDHSTKLHLVSPEGLDYIRQDVNSFPFNLERIAPEIDF
jgi:predicted ATPase